MAAIRCRIDSARARARLPIFRTPMPTILILMVSGSVLHAQAVPGSTTAR